MKDEIRIQFERAFKTDAGLCRSTCHCGKTYYNSDDPLIDWEGGELEELESNPNAFGVDFQVGTISLEGREYVDACDCWVEHAEKIIRFINPHARQIAEYLTLEKARKQQEADMSPVVR